MWIPCLSHSNFVKSLKLTKSMKWLDKSKLVCGSQEFLHFWEIIPRKFKKSEGGIIVSITQVPVCFTTHFVVQMNKWDLTDNEVCSIATLFCTFLCGITWYEIDIKSVATIFFFFFPNICAMQSVIISKRDVS